MNLTTVVAGQSYTITELLGTFTPNDPNIVGVGLEIIANPSQFTVIGGREILANPPYYFFNLYSTGPATSYFDKNYLPNDPSTEIQINATDSGSLTLTGYLGQWPADWFAGPNFPQLFHSWSVSFTVQPQSVLFTSGVDIVDFNGLLPDQQAAISAGADLYNALGGNDTITLPNANPGDTSVTIPGTSKTFDLTHTFVLGDKASDIATVVGGKGSYNIALGAGSDTVTINGDGNSTITAGSGTDTISITGNGNNTVTIGSGDAIVTISGTGNNTIIDGGANGVVITQFVGEGTDSTNGDILDITRTSSGNMTVGSQGVGKLDALFNGTVTFSGAGGTLQVEPSVDPYKIFVINGFAQGDLVDFTNRPGLTLEAAFYADTREVDIYDKATRVASLLFAGISTTTLEPISDGNGGTKIVVDPTNVLLSDPQPPGQPAGASIHWDIIHKNEGGFWLNPYVPINEKNPTGHSGLTIGYGVDLGNGIKQDEFSKILNSLGDDPNLVTKNPNLAYLYTATKPVIGPALQGAGALAYLNPPNGQEQIINGSFDGLPVKAPASISVSITESQANALTNQVEQDHLNALLKHWSGAVGFASLPWQAQTALMDVDFNHGNVPGKVLKDAITAAATITSSDPNATAAAWFTLASDMSHIQDNNPRMVSDALLVMQIAPGKTLAPPNDEPGTAIATNAGTYHFDVTDTTTQFAMQIAPDNTLAPSSGELGTALAANAAALNFDITDTRTQFVIGPDGSATYSLFANPGSPNFSSIELPTDAADLYSVSYEIGATWSAPQAALPDEVIKLPSSVVGIRVDLEDANGNPISDPGNFAFFVTFASTGAFTGTAYNLSSSAPVPHTITSVERFFDSATGDHFYTLSPDEANQIRVTLPTYHDEGAPWGTPNKGPDTIDVFRFFDVATGAHFFTTSTAERDQVMATLPSYHYEGVGFEAYAAPGDGSLTLERFFNTQTHVHHYAASAAEIASIQSGGAGPGWADEGAGFIVHT